MADVSKRARDAAGAAADRLRRAVEGSPLGGLLEDQQHNLNDLLGQVQNTELRAKLMALYEQQQHAFVELAHTVQTNVTAQQQHLADVLTAVEDTIKARRAKVEEADPVDDLSDDADDAEPPRAAPFADVPAANDAPADFAPPVVPAAPVKPVNKAASTKKAPMEKRAAAKKMAPPVSPVSPVTPLMTPSESDDDVPTPATIAKKVAAKKAAKKSAAKKTTQP